MEKKNNLFKSIFYIFFAFCFMGAGVFALQSNVSFVAEAENTTSSDIDNSEVPDYFLAKELIYNSEDGSTTTNTSSLISSNIFMYSTTTTTAGTTSNKLSLSLNLNGSAASGLYSYVYYPDTTDTSTFYFFSGVEGGISLWVNGTLQNLTGKSFLTTGSAFDNYSSVTPQSFNMIFDNSGSDSNAISILDDSNNVIEGLYTLQLTVQIYKCTGSNQDGNEENFSSLPTKTITYSFYVVSEKNYFTNSLPIITTAEFDSEVSASSSTSSVGYYLYSNYTSQTNVGSVTASNKVPYICYDMTRYEMAITKQLDGETNTSCALLYDTDGSTAVLSGDEIVLYRTSGNYAYVYFTNVGNYTISLSAIQLVNGTKYALDGITSQTKTIMVYMYGYQATYTDYDGEKDENNVRATSELKTIATDTSGNYSFSNSADITSQFVAYNENYSQANYSSTFLIGNVVEFINEESLSPVVTNQTPIKFASNATLLNGSTTTSYVLTTTKMSGYSTLSGYTLNGSTLYYTTFTGTTESTAGTYIYIIAYNFGSYRSSDGSLSTTTVFYQVFYFQIDKGSPTISVKTSANKTIYSDDFTNNTVLVTDTTKADSPYSKDVTVQIYAYDYNTGRYMTDFGGENGISLVNMISTGEVSGCYSITDASSYIIRLLANAKYTIRLYYTSEISSTSITSTTTKPISEMSFTIDAEDITGLTGRNVTKSGDYYQILDDITTLSTNQNFVLSWNEKASGASTTAYYRYFPLVSNTQFYTLSDDDNVSSLISALFKSSAIGVNYVLDLSYSRRWTELTTAYSSTNGNTVSFSTYQTISADYNIFSSSGLYLIQVVDAAGNSTLTAVMIDDSTPLFVLGDSTSYTLTSGTEYIKEAATLYWQKYKAIYISGLNSTLFRGTYSLSNLPDFTSSTYANDNTMNVFYNKSLALDNEMSLEIYKLLYQLYENGDLTYMDVKDGSNGSLTVREDVSSGGYIYSYSSMYLMIEIDEVSYYITDTSTTSYTAGTYASQSGVYSVTFDAQNELTYTVLIRDSSNTKLDLTLDKTAQSQYTTYYSAKQTIKVSFDSSELTLTYGDNAEELVSYINTTDDTSSTKTSYYHPSSLEEIFTVSFVPTTTTDDGKDTIQVSSVTITYYAYVTTSVTIGQYTYYYTELSSSPQEQTIYNYETGTDNTTPVTDSDSKTTCYYDINVSNNMTNAGKYVITRKYMTSDNFTYNTDKDYLTRTFEFYVDRYSVVSSPATADTSYSHVESLVGGDIFVSMFDSGTNASLVVTFPNSAYGNTDGNTLSSTTVTTKLTTNKLPVKLYVPQYKYTSYVLTMIDIPSGTALYVDTDLTSQTATSYNQKVTATLVSIEDNYIEVLYGETTYYLSKSASYTYHYGVTNTSGMNEYYSTTDVTQIISEYAIFAQLYKGDPSDGSNLVAITSSDISNPTIDTVTVTSDGFLDFYYVSGTNRGSVMSELTEAGEYYVVIYQGYFGTETSGENSYLQSLTFKFEIKSASPDFTATNYPTGQSLNYTTTSFTSTSGDKGTTIYYTNQPEITLTWDAVVGSNYMVQIDVDAITFTTSSGATYTTSSDIWTEAPTLQSSSYYQGTINLEKMTGVYTNGGYVDITMQFENHNDTYYTKVTKRIYVDLSTPSTTITSLVSLVTSNGLVSELTDDKALRIYETAKGDTTNSSASNISYNYSNNTGTFANYSYTVQASFLSTLKSNQDYITYIKEVPNKYTSSVAEAIPSEFTVSNGYSQIGTFTALTAGTYYEVVETDLAGNMTIFTIYVVDYTTEQTLISATSLNASGEEISRDYTTSDYTEANAYSGSTHTIYARTGFSLSDINYFGDEWAIMKLVSYTSSGTTSTKIIMLSPTLDSGYAYVVSGSTYERVKLSELIDGNTSLLYKHTLTIYNRENSKTDTFYFNIYNTSLSATLTSSQTLEYITFTQPSDTDIQSTTRGSTFLTSMTITSKETSASQAVILYSSTNKLGYASLWTATSTNSVTVSSDTTTSKLTFTVKTSLAANTKVTYTYTDNYGNSYTEIHLYNEPIITTEVAASGDLYAFTDNTDGLLYYITQNTFIYTYNPYKYNVALKIKTTSAEAMSQSDLAKHITAQSDGTYKLTITADDLGLEAPYNICYVLEITDADDNSAIKEIYFYLYDELPKAVTTGTTTTGTFRLTDANGNNITSQIMSSDESGYFSEVRLYYSLADTEIPIIYSISTDGVKWEEISSGTRLRNSTTELQTYYLKVWYDEDYLENTYGSYAYVFQNVPSTQIYTFNLSSLTSTYWVEWTENGETTVVTKESTAYEVTDEASGSYYGAKYTNHYIVNVAYEESATSDTAAVKVQLNKEQELTATHIINFTNGSVISELILITNSGSTSSNVTKFSVYIVISFIPPSDSIVSEFYTTNVNGVLESTNLISSTSKTIVVSSEYSTSQITLQWTKYYGIQENVINISLVKDGIMLEPEIYSTRVSGVDYYYTYLTYSGKYVISFADEAGNVQKFNSGNSGQSQTFTLILLKDVPFTVTYTDTDGESITTLPIAQAVFNSSVTLKIDASTRAEFYALGGYPEISVKLNGSTYNGNFGTNATEFTFTEAGYYEVTFSATALATSETLRQETYQFTILNPNEYKISYIYNKYSNYYVEKVVRDGIDITSKLLTLLDTDTITVDGKKYLSTLSLSYLDEKTGAGVYLITVNSNSSLYKNSSLITNWTYKVTINQGTTPLKISSSEGEETTDTITITCNLENMYTELGECTLRIVKLTDSGGLGIVGDTISITSESTGTTNKSITTAGTYFVQVLSAGGTLLFSYKVVKNDPMNAATIIIIVVVVIVAVALIFIIYKLRKRVSVK